MPKQLALLFCIGFVWWLLQFDRKQRYPRTSALWLPTIWILAISSRPLDSWSNFNIGASGAVLDPLFHGTMLCIGLIVLGRRDFNWGRAFRANWWLFVLVGYMLTSIVWSDMIFVSFKRCVRELTALVMALVVLTEPAPLQALQSLFRRTIYVLVPFSLLLIKYYPPIGVMYSRWTGEIQWIGVTLQKNSLGRICLTAIFFLIWTLIRRRKRREPTVARYQNHADIFVLFLSAWLLRGPSMWAASATAIYALTAGLLGLWGLSWSRRHKMLPGPTMLASIVAVIVVVGTITPFVGGSNLAGFTSAVGRDSTFTGRTEIWAEYVPAVKKRPLFGYGFGGFYKVPAEAHNGYLDVWLGLGFVGVVITGMFLVSTVRRAALLLPRNFDWAALTICFTVMAAIHNISESSFDSLQRQLMAVVMFVSVIAIPHAAKASVTRSVRATIPKAQPQRIPTAIGF